MAQQQISLAEVASTLATQIGPANFATALVAINFASFALFGIDKARAETGAWRVRETTLLQLAFFGGTVGAYAGRALFRHKTRKEPFSSSLFNIAMLQTLFAGGWLGWIYF